MEGKHALYMFIAGVIAMGFAKVSLDAVYPHTTNISAVLALVFLGGLCIAVYGPVVFTLETVTNA